MDIRKISAILMRLTAVLLILVLLSTGIVTGRYARYMSTVSGSDMVRVAKFSVVESGDVFTENIPVRIIPGGSAETVIAVANESEVAVEYTIDAENPFGNFPLAFSIRYGGLSYDVPFSANMAPGASVDFVLETTWNGNADVSYSGQVDLIEISLIAAQID